MEKKKAPPENSIALRIVCCLMAIISITASFIFGESAVPVIQFDPMQMAIVVLCIWLCIGGGVFSYHFRGNPPPAVAKLIKVGAFLIIINLARELWEDNLYSMQFQFVRPLMHALVAASVLTSFELRTRSDIIASATFGLLLLSVAAASGKSVLFGAIVFLYICLGGELLMLSCQSQTKHEGENAEQSTLVKLNTRGTTTTAAALTGLLLPILSVALFCVIPRLDNEADSISARVRTFATATLYQLRKDHSVDLMPNQDAIGRAAGPNRLDSARRREEARHNKESEPKTDEPQSEQTAQPVPIDHRHGNKSSETSKTPNPALPKAKTPKSAAAPAAGQDPAAEHHGGKVPSQTKKPDDSHDSQPVPANSSSAVGNDAKPQEPADQVESPADTQNANHRQQANRPERDQPAKKSDAQATENLSTDSGKASTDSTAESSKPGAKTDATKATSIMDESSISLDQGMTNPNEPLFSLACTRSVYTKFMAMDEFDGIKWSRQSLGDAWSFDPTPKGVSLDCAPLRISYATPIMELVQTYNIESNLGYYVPVAGIPQHISLVQPLEVDDFGSIKAKFPLVAGTEYSVLAQLPIYSLEDMRNAQESKEPEPEGIDFYLQIPKNQSQKLFQLAAEISGNDGNRFRRTERILRHLRKGYRYSLKPVAAPKAKNLVDAFLFNTKLGDCKAFASAFVMMCRAVDIPARCVIGYLPGDFDPMTGATHVKRKHCHAWAEVFIPPYGWIPFDATPTGQLPSRPEESYYNYERLQKEIKAHTDRATSSSLTVVKSALSLVGRIIGALALVVAVFALYLVAKALKGVIPKIVNSLFHRHPATKIKDKMVKRLIRYGVNRSPADTVSDIAQKFTSRLNEQNGDTRIAYRLTEFMSTYNAVYFGQEDKMDKLKELDREIATLLSSASSRRN